MSFCFSVVQIEDPDATVTVDLRSLNSELKCPICLGILRKTMIVMTCLHRFCSECIQKSLRVTAANNTCPACREHIPSRRSLRPDVEFDALIATIYPDLEAYEDQEQDILRTINKAHHRQQEDSRTRAMRARIPGRPRRRGDGGTTPPYAAEEEEPESSPRNHEPPRAPRAAPPTNHHFAATLAADSYAPRVSLPESAPPAAHPAASMAFASTEGQASAAAAAGAGGGVKRPREGAEDVESAAKRPRTAGSVTGTGSSDTDRIPSTDRAGPRQRGFITKSGESYSFQAMPHFHSVLPALPRPFVTCPRGIQMRQLKKFVVQRIMRTWNKDPERWERQVAAAGLTKDRIVPENILFFAGEKHDFELRERDTVMFLLEEVWPFQTDKDDKRVFYCHVDEAERVRTQPVPLEHLPPKKA